MRKQNGAIRADGKIDTACAQPVKAGAAVT
jgi:hypothetical protein